ncbi:MAG: Gfo/Idh/MocA family oxidoreductase [Bacteroidales bacterium]
MKIGLIGINSVQEEKHFATIQQVLKNNLFGIFSPHTEEVHALSKKYNISLYPSATALCQDVDAVYFANPLKPNINFAINALKNSCHVFIENFSDLSLDEIKQLYKLSFEARVLLQIKQTILFTPEFKLIKKELTNPKFVEIDYFFSKILRQQDYFYQIFNAIGIITSSINSGIKKVNITPVRIDENILSFAFVYIEFDNGSIAKIKINNLSQDDEKLVKVYQVNDFIEVDFKKHFVCKHSLVKGHTERRELGIFYSDPFESEIKSFIHQSKNIKSLNISESPEVLQDIQAAQAIINKFYF